MTALLLLAALASAQEVSPEPQAVESADATDGVHIWAQQRVAVAGWPQGAMSDTRVQVRAPMHRSKSVLFQDTYAGAGMRAAVTPAFTAVGPRLSIAPLDIFDLDVQASYIRYYGGKGIGLIAFPETAHKLESDREGRASTKGDALQVTAAPTLKLKLGPIIAFDSWTFGYTSIAPGQAHDEEMVYEPYSDLVVEWNDITIEQQGAVIYEIVPDEGAAFFWAGVTARDRLAVRSQDRSTTAGLVLRGRPAKGKAMPTITGQALMYLNDADRVGMAPSLALLADWKLAKAL
ncbi:MAG: hypothetical protein KC912_16500 [Proteobacteria bacterium]|nr:hypothetical protein [Pseudomonadota bacterium]